MDYTTKEIAEVCEISLRTIQYWIKDNIFVPPQKFRDQYIWTENDLIRLKEFIKENKSKRKKTRG